MLIMKIAVCIKQVPVQEWQPRIDETGRGDPRAGRQLRDERARRLRARGGAAAPRAARRRGRGVHGRAGARRRRCCARRWRAAPIARCTWRTTACPAADAFVIAGVLAEAIRDEAFDLVLTGLQSDDQGAAQTGVILAERLGLPHATIVMDVQVDGRLAPCA